MIIGVGIGGHVIKKNAGKTMTTAETESKKAVSKKKATAKKLTINENETDASNKENQGQKDQADDRSEFAVQPGRKVGTTEQSDEKVVYLTLDDGPSKNTQAVLDILDKYNAKATFFVTGAMPEYKDMINDGRSMLQISPWMVLAPGMAIFITVMIFNLLGDTIRDYMDPKERNRRKG